LNIGVRSPEIMRTVFKLYCLPYVELFQVTKGYARTKDSRDEVHETHSACSLIYKFLQEFHTLCRCQLIITSILNNTI